ncbi:MAG: hypothetical protein E3J71_04175 [Candidatus Stahlbacteria bacterium]|nr:MAG: hypothetical protein E3J71_04175 [Candidatus Stahlbacteria bacterium]
MNSEKKGFLAEITTRRANLLEVLVIAVLIALGVNLLTASFLSFLSLPPAVLISIGSGLALIGVFYLLFRILARRTQIRNYQGFIVYDFKTNALVNVNRYHLAEELTMLIKAAFTENKDLQTIWNEYPLRDIHIKPAETKEGSNSEAGISFVFPYGNGGELPKSVKLIEEAVEYYVLNELSRHISFYFEDEFEKKHLITLKREDIPDVLMKNRFLDLLTKPMDERTAFLKSPAPISKDKKNIWLSYSQTGALFQHFELVLPRKSVVTRLKGNQIEIKTRGFKLTIGVDFIECGSILPYGFGEYYLQRKFDVRLPLWRFKINVGVRADFNWGTILSGVGKRYCRWVDSFLDRLDETISEERFFDGIGWKSAVTVIEGLKGRTSRKGRM